MQLVEVDTHRHPTYRESSTSDLLTVTLYSALKEFTPMERPFGKIRASNSSSSTNHYALSGQQADVDGAVRKVRNALVTGSVGLHLCNNMEKKRGCY